jgi:hypothetical protein
MWSVEEKLNILYRAGPSNQASVRDIRIMNEFNRAPDDGEQRQVAALEDLNVWNFLDKYAKFWNNTAAWQRPIGRALEPNSTPLLRFIENSPSWQRTLNSQVLSTLTYNGVFNHLVDEYVVPKFGIPEGTLLWVTHRRLPEELCERTFFYDKYKTIQEILDFSEIHAHNSIVYQNIGIVIVGHRKMIFYPFLPPEELRISKQKTKEYIPLPALTRQGAFGQGQPGAGPSGGPPQLTATPLENQNASLTLAQHTQPPPQNQN